ncbi:transcription factor pcl1 [Phtheirospermum japonicum]|uniref:Transcription factor pcl1 n=1 Tax=Phtheirospermum japonicum TaxID=374723 RepID=A0A830C627_9LAMI|nr:transcription factor pcl1 [Phtheirospermum japonicum]
MMINSHNSKSDFSEKMQNCHDYIQALELERQKVQVFQRELPLCLELVTQAIETCKQQLSEKHNLNGRLSECSEQTSSPVFEEFIPIKRALSHCEDDDEDEQESKKAKNENSACDKDEEINGCNNNNNEKNEKNSKKSDWLRSVQLWNQTPDPLSNTDSTRKSTVLEVKKNGSGGAFHPFKKEKNVGGGEIATRPGIGPAPPPSTSSTAETGGSDGGGNKKEEKEGQSQRKTRRSWSPELHTRFLQALQQLGGSHVATPKQIRELMKVDGLTNDEVKSHLQKYRLHTRRPSPSTHNNNNNNNTQRHQFVVVGGIWVPPEYAAMAATTKSEAGPRGAAPKGIYAPVASLPPPFHETSSSPKQRRNHSDDRGDDSHSYSPATSSSSGHKTNVSPAC